RPAPGRNAGSPGVGAMTGHSSPWPFLLAALLAALGGGCSFEPSRYAISGTVKANGAPVALAVVKFIAVGPDADPRSGGMGVADEAGKFTIGGEPGKNTGLPAGGNKGRVSQNLVNGKPTLGGRRGARDGGGEGGGE